MIAYSLSKGKHFILQLLGTSGSVKFTLPLVPRDYVSNNEVIYMQQIVLPIKDSNVLKEVQDTLLNNFKAGRRNYTIFQVGKATLLRVSDVMCLKQADIFNPDGSIKQNAFIHDRKTGKPNTLYLKPVQTELLLYRQWLLDHKLESEWLFPSIQHPERHITEKQFYKIMR
ncbi:tyrosine recombinase [Liquorilactobacillus uvarum DSM 19971]|uniref:Tyrosine recombinase n=1 Tax=Liquorilactobacillus uvarum DSM 19971 TaxID=1423812 RepID=A0A0R1PKM8_9LACO|nr:tyrosine recombinase [Liquorilactobacillus uvarum DSM 19971]